MADATVTPVDATVTPIEASAKERAAATADLAVNVVEHGPGTPRHPELHDRRRPNPYTLCA